MGAMSRRLRSWLIGCGALALVAAGWTFIVTDLLHERSHYTAEAAERTRARAMIFARFADTTFASAAVALHELAAQAEVSATRPADRAPLRAVLQRTVQTIPIFYGIALVGADGSVLATSQDNAAPLTLGDQAYFGWHRRNPGSGLHVSPPMVTWLDTLWAIPISMRIDDAKGAFDGLIVGLLKPDYFTGFIRDLGVDSALVALADGTVLVSEPAPLVSSSHRSLLDRQMIGEWREQASAAAATMSPQRRRPVDVTLNADSGPQAASYVNLETIPAAVFARISLDRVLGPWQQSARYRVIGGGLLSILTFLLALLAISGMRRDVKRSMALRAARDEAQLARQRAEEADRNKSVFLAHTSHELRTPLNAIIGFSEVLAREVFGPLDKRYREYSRDIHHSGQHLLAVVNNILDLAKVSADHWELAHERFSLPELLDDIGRFATPEAELRSVDLKRDVPEDFPELYTDRRVVKQILLNLITNGIKFTPAGGVVAVAASRHADGGIIIMIIDTGVGIDPADLDKVVKPFRNISNLLARKEGGTGLGLPLCRAFVDLLGGDLAITSQPGEGTSVMVRLPASCIAAGSIGEVDATAA